MHNDCNKKKTEIIIVVIKIANIYAFILYVYTYGTYTRCVQKITVILKFHG